MPGPRSQQGIPPQIDYSAARAIPVNFCNLRHTNEEFLIDVGMSGADPVSTKAQIDTSIIISPFTAKRLWLSLGTIITSYEQIFGDIEVEAENRTVAPRPVPMDEAPIAPATRPVPPPTLTRQFRGPIGPPEMVQEITLPFSSETPPAPEPDSTPPTSPCIPARFDKS